jgi:hypothetical protein
MPFCDVCFRNVFRIFTMSLWGSQAFIFELGEIGKELYDSQYELRNRLRFQ